MIGSMLIAAGIGLAAVWVVLAAIVFALRSPGQPARELVCVFPAALRLAVALYRDPIVPSSVRWRLRIALIYNLQPVNLIPDVIPVVGFADNVAVMAWALRSTLRLAGVDVVGCHWSGSSESLAVLYRALRLPGPEANVGPLARESI